MFQNVALGYTGSKINRYSIKLPLPHTHRHTGTHTHTLLNSRVQGRSHGIGRRNVRRTFLKHCSGCGNHSITRHKQMLLQTNAAQKRQPQLLTPCHGWTALPGQPPPWWAQTVQCLCNVISSTAGLSADNPIKIITLIPDLTRQPWRPAS